MPPRATAPKYSPGGVAGNAAVGKKSKFGPAGERDAAKRYLEPSLFTVLERNR